MTEQFNSFYKISLTGDLGSGKSTVCALLSNEISAQVVSIGTIQRAKAKEMGMDTCEFNKYMETHPEIDDEFDTMLKSYDDVSGRNLLFDSRLAWNFVPSAFSVYITTDLKVAATRVYNAHRENEGYSDINTAMEKLSERRDSEKLRYSKAYGVDIKDMGNYNFIIDSTVASPQDVASEIIGAYNRFSKDGRSNFARISPTRLYPVSNDFDGDEIKAFEYNGFYFVCGGLGLLENAIKNRSILVDVGLVSLTEEEKLKVISKNYNALELVRWEERLDFKFVRYPVLEK